MKINNEKITFIIDVIKAVYLIRLMFRSDSS